MKTNEHITCTKLLLLSFEQGNTHTYLKGSLSSKQTSQSSIHKRSVRFPSSSFTETETLGNNTVLLLCSLYGCETYISILKWSKCTAYCARRENLNGRNRGSTSRMYKRAQ